LATDNDYYYCYCLLPFFDGDDGDDYAFYDDDGDYVGYHKLDYS